MSWIPTEPSLFFSKQDAADLRFGDFAMACDPTTLMEKNYDLALWGYGDDEGIALNGGRPGAALAPQRIRSAFYKMTPHVLFPRQAKLVDFGDVNPKLALDERHQAGLAMALSATAKNRPWISLGGGHDYGYADGAGFLRALQKSNAGKKPVVLNFDAHLDVRPSRNIWHSGTPFYRLLSEFGSSFHFFEIGLQPQCNSRAHWDWALTQGAQLLPLAMIEEEGLLQTLSRILAPFEGHPLWVSFDIDSLRSSEAPGCSQSWTTGLETKEVLKVFYWLTHHLDWQALSIYEVSPPLDVDLITVRTAALLMHQFASLSFLRQGTSLLGTST
jgi:formiminoglutamase